MGDLGHHDRDLVTDPDNNGQIWSHRLTACWFLHAAWFSSCCATGRGYRQTAGPLLALVFFLPIVAIGLSGALNWNMEDE